MKRRLYPSIVSLVAALAIAPVISAHDIDVYIITGQSNSLGTTGLEGGAPNYEPGTDSSDGSTNLFWSNVSAANTGFPPVLYGDSGGSITTLQMQQGDGGANPHFWGPEFGLSRALAKNSRGNNVLIIKASRGGGGNGLWDKDALEANNNSGHMWGHLVETVDAALGQINAGTNFKVKGLIYMQGESNNSGQAAIADTRLAALADNLRSHINTNHNNSATKMYTVAAEIAASSSIGNRTLTTSLQRGLANTNSGIGFVTTSDQPLKGDDIHFGKNAKLTYGNRIADAFNSKTYVESKNLLAGYSADANPNSPIPDPSGLGFSFAGNVTGVTGVGVEDGAKRAWRLIDDSNASNPAYRTELIGTDFDKMFSSGWKFDVSAKVVEGGGLATWSVTQANDPGWNLNDARNMNGLLLERINGDELRVSISQGQQTFDLGAGSADEFHDFQMIGKANSSLFDFYVDGQLRASNLDLRNGNGVDGFDDILQFNSGSTGGTNRDVYWNKVSLSAIVAVRRRR